MILGKLVASAVNGISTFIGRMRAQSVSECEAIGDSIGIPERFLDEGFTPQPELPRSPETFYPPPWINMADFKE